MFSMRALVLSISVDQAVSITTSTTDHSYRRRRSTTTCHLFPFLLPKWQPLNKCAAGSHRKQYLSCRGFEKGPSSVDRLWPPCLAGHWLGWSESPSLSLMNYLDCQGHNRCFGWQICRCFQASWTLDLTRDPSIRWLPHRVHHLVLLCVSGLTEILALWV